MTRHRPVGPREEPDHPDDGRGVHGAARTLVVEGDVAARHGRVERAACVGDAAAGFFELVEHGGPLRAAEVEAVGDAERARASARDVPRRLGDRRLAALVWVEQDVAAVAVHRVRDSRYVLLDPYEGGKAAVAEA